MPATAGGGTDQARAKAAVKLEAAKHKLEEADQLRQDAAAMPSLAAQLQELRDVLHGMAKSKPTGTAAAHPAAPPAVPAAKAEPMETVKFSLGGGVTMDFVLIRPGNFIMGSPFEHHAIPPRKVWITKRFCMGKYPVTQAQWQQVMGANPSQFKGAQNPVENVSWDDCQLFLVKLRERNPRIDFRLPTEAQREYACRAGTTTKYSFGDSDAVQEDYAWCHGNSGDKPHPVGGKKPNPWGLFDMHGNVLEWCADWYGGIYAADETVDPSGPSAGQDRVLRGGSWFNGVAHAGSANRDMRYPPATKSSNIGFRLVVIP